MNAAVESDEAFENDLQIDAILRPGAEQLVALDGDLLRRGMVTHLEGEQLLETQRVALERIVVLGRLTLQRPLAQQSLVLVVHDTGLRPRFGAGRRIGHHIGRAMRHGTDVAILRIGLQIGGIDSEVSVGGELRGAILRKRHAAHVGEVLGLQRQRFQRHAQHLQRSVQHRLRLHQPERAVGRDLPEVDGSNHHLEGVVGVIALQSALEGAHVHRQRDLKRLRIVLLLIVEQIALFVDAHNRQHIGGFGIHLPHVGVGVLRRPGVLEEVVHDAGLAPLGLHLVEVRLEIEVVKEEGHLVLIDLHPNPDRVRGDLLVDHGDGLVRYAGGGRLECYGFGRTEPVVAGLVEAEKRIVALAAHDLRDLVAAGVVGTRIPEDILRTLGLVAQVGEQVPSEDVHVELGSGIVLRLLQHIVVVPPLDIAVLESGPFGNVDPIGEGRFRGLDDRKHVDTRQGSHLQRLHLAIPLVHTGRRIDDVGRSRLQLADHVTRGGLRGIGDEFVPAEYLEGRGGYVVIGLQHMHASHSTRMLRRQHNLDARFADLASGNGYFGHRFSVVDGRGYLWVIAARGTPQYAEQGRTYHPEGKFSYHREKCLRVN